MGRRCLKVDVAAQRLEVWEGGEMVVSYPVSTSAYGLGFEEGSLKTPTGWFRICGKVGDGLPMGAVFKGRRWTGEIWDGSRGDEDAILTRVLLLDGLDRENANTRERLIYVHGTNREDLIGTPSSHGCVRMRNGDILELFERVCQGDVVKIE